MKWQWGKDSLQNVLVFIELEVRKEITMMSNIGWTITFIPWEDIEGLPRVAGRFKTDKEKDEFINRIYQPDSGWTDEELESLSIINDYYYRLPR